MIYLDSCIVIYAVEDESRRGEKVRQRLADAGSTEFSISPLVMMECLVGPLRTENLMLRDQYQRVFSLFHVLPSGPAEFVRAAELRAHSGVSTPDALHLATAQLASAQELWTNDGRLANVARGLAVDVLGQ